MPAAILDGRRAGSFASPSTGNSPVFGAPVRKAQQRYNDGNPIQSQTFETKATPEMAIARTATRIAHRNTGDSPVWNHSSFLVGAAYDRRGPGG